MKVSLIFYAWSWNMKLSEKKGRFFKSFQCEDVGFSLIFIYETSFQVMKISFSFFAIVKPVVLNLSALSFLQLYRLFLLTSTCFHWKLDKSRISTRKQKFWDVILKFKVCHATKLKKRKVENHYTRTSNRITFLYILWNNFEKSIWIWKNNARMSEC